MSLLCIDDLIELARRDYEVNQCPYASVFRSQVKHLSRHLGMVPIRDLDFQAIEDYKLLRIRQGAARDTINKELGGLRKGFRIAVDAQLLDPASVPTIRRLKPGRPRSGFLTVDDFRRICGELPPAVRDFAEFAYWSGWRLDEIRNLSWANTNRQWAWCHSKNGDIKLAPLEGHLELVMERRRKQRIGEWVFHRAGRQIRSVRKAWNGACRRAGLEGRVFHDLRRSFVRNAIRAGVDRDTAMALSGHRSDAVFRRYNIQDEGDLVDAARRLGRI